MLFCLMCLCMVSITSVTSTCTNPTAMVGFNATAHTGLWYIVKHSEDSALNNMSCMNQEFSISKNNQVTVKTNFYSTVKLKYISFTRTLQTTAANSSSFTFVSPRNGDSYLNIIDTDYNSYSIIWVCHETASRGVWVILSREKIAALSGKAEKQVPTLTFKTPNQQDCPNI